jgi:hypothetical protein
VPAGGLFKPAQLKIVSGTVRPDREAPPSVVFDPLAGVPDPVDWLPNAHAVSEWRRLAPVLVANKLLAAADLERGEEATFFARYAPLFHGIGSDGWLESLAAHADWRGAMPQRTACP